MCIFNLFVLLIMPLTMIGFGLLFVKNPPKTRNVGFGYRTTWSMKSQETWDFAHYYMGKAWLYAGIPLGLVTILLLIVFRNLDKDALGNIMLVVFGLQFIGLLLPIVPTEVALKSRFDKKGTLGLYSLK